MPISVQTSPSFEVFRNVFELPLTRGGKHSIDQPEAKKIFTSATAKRRGCYIFAITKNGKTTPWYVGKTKINFSQEVFNDSNCKKYAEALDISHGGKPQLLLVMHPVKKGAVNKTAITKLEHLLISDCGGQNPQLRN